MGTPICRNSERLFPALAEHFGLDGGAKRVFVHDAFVVRYEEGKQRHLPLHRDQSTHSFTVSERAHATRRRLV